MKKLKTLSARGHVLALGLLVTVAGALPAAAQVDLTWALADTVTAPGTPTQVSILLTDTQDLRTVEFTAAYDTALVTSLSGGPGALFTAFGFDLFSGFREDTPGVVHGYVIIMGHGDFTTGPGELFTWNISGKSVGTSLIEVLDVKLYTPDGLLLPGVTLSDTSVVFRAPSAAPDDLPAAAVALSLSPNPFNPRTRVSFDLPEGSPAQLSVFDARGRLIDVLFDGDAPAGRLDLVWDGRDRHGRTQPGGTYLFRLKTRSGVARTKGLLLK